MKKHLLASTFLLFLFSVHSQLIEDQETVAGVFFIYVSAQDAEMAFSLVDPELETDKQLQINNIIQKLIADLPPYVNTAEHDMTMQLTDTTVTFSFLIRIQAQLVYQVDVTFPKIQAEALITGVSAMDEKALRKAGKKPLQQGKQ